MVGNKLDLFKLEVNHYLGLPYFKNTGRWTNHGNNAQVGKGTAREIAFQTIELANQQHLKLVNLSAQQIYNFQKKNHLGIDCSGLACQLLLFWAEINDRHLGLNPRRVSADMLTSSPLAIPINLATTTTGDLVRQRQGHHVVLIIENCGDTIDCVQSSLSLRGVVRSSISISDPLFFNQGIYRLNQLI